MTDDRAGDVVAQVLDHHLHDIAERLARLHDTVQQLVVLAAEAADQRRRS